MQCLSGWGEGFPSLRERLLSIPHEAEELGGLLGSSAKLSNKRLEEELVD